MLFGEIRKTPAYVAPVINTPTFFRGNHIMEEEDEALGLTGMPASLKNKAATKERLEQEIVKAKAAGFLQNVKVTPKKNILGFQPGDHGLILYYNSYPEGTTAYGDIHELKVMAKGVRVNLSHTELELVK